MAAANQVSGILAEKTENFPDVSGASVTEAEKWHPRFWANEGKVSMRFATTAELDAAIDWLWTVPDLREMGHGVWDGCYLQLMHLRNEARGIDCAAHGACVDGVDGIARQPRRQRRRMDAPFRGERDIVSAGEALVFAGRRVAVTNQDYSGRHF